MMEALWSYRHFILASIVGDLRARYARSRLGLFWHILHPLAQATIFAVVLADVLGSKLGPLQDRSSYPLYLLSGMAAWSLFSDIVRQCITMFIDHSSALKKIAFPRLCLPLIVIGNALFSHILLLAAIAVVFFFYGRLPNMAWIALPVGALLVVAFGAGLGLFLGIFNVFSRDVGQVMSVVLQLWFWVTPVVYPASVVPDHLRSFLAFNPMSELVELYQNVLVYGILPLPSALIWPFTAAIVLCVLAFAIFRRASPEIVDAL